MGLRSSVTLSAAVSALLLSLSACGGGSDNSQIKSDKDCPIVMKGDLKSIASHAEIVRCAEKLGGVRILTAVDDTEAVQKEFTAAYPKIKVDKVEYFSGSDTWQRFLLEADADSTGTWDVVQVPPELYGRFRDQFVDDWDLLGMAQSGTLDIPVKMIDPKSRKVAATATIMGGIAYDAGQVDPADIPTTWEGFLDPRWSSQNTRLAMDVRPSNMAPLVVNWGLSRTVKYAGGLAAQKPILTRGQTDALTRVAAGESAIHILSNYHSALGVQEDNDANSSFKIALIDPVPVRLTETLGVFKPNISKNPYAALLFIEWMASDAGQKLLDREPLRSSMYGQGQVAQMLKGHEVSVMDFSVFDKAEGWMTAITKGMGLPTS
jgi:iron(III) transport system substrate-binding protein